MVKVGRGYMYSHKSYLTLKWGHLLCSLCVSFKVILHVALTLCTCVCLCIHKCMNICTMQCVQQRDIT